MTTNKYRDKNYKMKCTNVQIYKCTKVGNGNQELGIREQEAGVTHDIPPPVYGGLNNKIVQGGGYDESKRESGNSYGSSLRGAGEAPTPQSKGLLIQPNEQCHPAFIAGPSEIDCFAKTNNSELTTQNLNEIWHLDLYRLKSSDELYELGLDEALEKAICLIEWPEIAAGFLKNVKTTLVEIEKHGEDRVVRIRKLGA
jgi:hypothetical protein